MAGPPERVRKAATQARQGRPGRPVLWVLIASLLLSVAAVVVVWVWLSGDLAGTDNRSTPTGREAASFHTTPQPSS